MSVQLDAREVTQPGVWAQNAQTVIPAEPVSGVSYRDNNINAATMEFGQAYDTVADSRVWNQQLYVLSALVQDSERFGFIRWSPRMGLYPIGSKVTATDGNDYRAILPNGAAVSAGARNPLTEPEYWQSYREYVTGGVGGTFIAGDIQLKAFRPDAMPFGWYFCNGSRYSAGSSVANALVALPDNYRTDWGIVTTSEGTTVPNLLNSGNGYFLRAVDGVTRMPGSTQQDAIRNIVGGAGPIAETFGAYGSATGAFYKTDANAPSSVDANRNSGYINFDASRSVPTADENRPINIGMTPAIYLGV